MTESIVACARKMPWPRLYSAAAGLTFFAAFQQWSFFCLGFSFISAPWTFLDLTVYLVFSFMMLVLDLPMEYEYVQIFADKYANFSTRFTGRGLWYMFLGTVTWIFLSCEPIYKFQILLGGIVTTYLTIIGFLALLQGLSLTRRLNKIRESIQRRGETAANYFVPNDPKPMSKEIFRAVFEQHDCAHHTDVEINFMLNAISRRFDSKDTITSDEFDEWLGSPSTMYLV